MEGGKEAHNAQEGLLPSEAAQVSEPDAESATRPMKRLSSSRTSESSPSKRGVTEADSTARRKHELRLKECLHFGCEKCGFATAGYTMLEQHVWRRHHIIVHRCRACGLISYDQSTEEAHRLAGCPMIGIYECEDCDWSFLNVSAWQFHTRENHLADQAHGCCYCSYESECLGNITEHEEKHTNEDYSLRCPFCAWGGYRMNGLLHHITIEHAGKPKPMVTQSAKYREARLLLSQFVHQIFFVKPKYVLFLRFIWLFQDNFLE